MPPVPDGSQVVRPTRGTWRFRRTSGLTVQGRALVVIDHRGGTHRFAFDGSEEAPARYLISFDSWWWMIVDGKNRAIVRGHTGEWDWREIVDVIGPFGVTDGFAPNMEPDPEPRHDMVELRQPAWAPWVLRAMAAAGGLGFAVAALAQSDVVPPGAAVAFFVAVGAMAVVAIKSGLLAPGRRSKSTPHVEAIVAEWEAKQAAKKAKEERRAKRKREQRKRARRG